MDLIKSGLYHRQTEEAQLKQRAEEKVNLGHTQRLKQGKVQFTSNFVYRKRTESKTPKGPVYRFGTHGDFSLSHPYYP